MMFWRGSKASVTPMSLAVSGMSCDEPLRADARDDGGIVVRFGLDDRAHERLGDAVVRLLVADVVVVARVARGRGVARGHEIRAAPQRARLAGSRLEPHLPAGASLSRGRLVGELDDPIGVLADPEGSGVRGRQAEEQGSKADRQRWGDILGRTSAASVTRRPERTPPLRGELSGRFGPRDRD